MTDIYMNGAEVHAETPEEELEASLILNAALSGKRLRRTDASVRLKGIPRSVKAFRCVFAMVRI